MLSVYLAFDGDHVGRKIGRSVLADDPGEVGRVSQAIAAGEELWRAFAVRCGGKVVSMGGDEGSFELGARHLAQVPDVARQYAQVVGATVSVGVGRKLSESAKALLIAKTRGGDQIVVWEPEMEAEVQRLTAHPKTEEQKISEEYLGKAQGLFREAAFRHLGTGSLVGTGPFHDPDQLPGGEDQLRHYEAGFLDHVGKFYTREEAASALHQKRPAHSEQVLKREDNAAYYGVSGQNAGSHAGFEGHHRQNAKQSENSGIAKAPKESDGPPPPEATHSADGLEDQLHGIAGAQSQRDDQAAQSQDSHLDEVRDSVAKTLEFVRERLPQIQQLRQAAPEAYASIFSLTQGLIALGREVFSGGSVQKSEDLEKSVAQIQPGKRTISGPGRLSFDYSHVLPESARAEGMGLKVTHVAAVNPVDEHTVSALHHNGKVVGSVTSYLRKHGSRLPPGIEPHSMLLPNYQGRGLGQAMYEAAYAHAKSALGVTHVEGGPHSEQAHALHQRLAAKHGFEYGARPDPELAGTDYPFAPYSYALKGEAEPVVDDAEIVGPRKGVTFYRGIQKAESLDKATAGPEGGAQEGRQHLELPAGSVKDGEMKVVHSDGKTGWKHLQSGMVAGRDDDSPLIGAVTHPVSSREPSAK